MCVCGSYLKQHRPGYQSNLIDEGLADVEQDILIGTRLYECLRFAQDVLYPLIASVFGKRVPDAGLLLCCACEIVGVRNEDRS